MIKKTITYEGFDGEEVTENLYFNFTKVELAKMLMEDDSLIHKLESIIELDDDDPDKGKEIMSKMDYFILASYGERDGNRFIKTQAIRDAFASSEAYSQIFMSVCTDAELAAEFLNGIMPKDIMVEARKLADASDSKEETKLAAVEDSEKLDKLEPTT